jgi:parallel beta-helix repeat protein
MKKLFIIIAVLLLPCWVGAVTTYYVDTTCTDTNPASATVDGTAYDPATPACTGGSDSYYVTMADINAAAATLTPGDTVSLRKGQTWRETLTWPETGTSGNIYTLTSHGTGNAPIISGSDVLTTWTQQSGDESIESQTNNNNQWDRDYAAAYYMTQGWQHASGVDISRIDVNLKKTGSPTGNCSIEIWNTSGTPSRYSSVLDTSDSLDVSTLTTSFVTKQFTFSPAASISATTDYIFALSCDFAVDAVDYVSMEIQTGDNYRGGDPYRIQLYASGPTYDSGADHDFTFTIYKNVVTNVYSKDSITTEPHIVFYNGSILTENDTATTGVGSSEWDWDSNTLYVNVGENPDTSNLEASQRDYTINTNGADYLKIDGITVTHSNTDSIYAINSSNFTVDNSTVTYNGAKGIVFGTTSSNNSVEDNTISYNGLGAQDNYGVGIWAWKDAGSSGNENYISRNTINNNKNYGIVINANYYIIEENKVYNNGDISAMGVGIETWNNDDDGYGDNIIIRYNLCYGQLSSANDGTGINADDNSSNITIYGNVAYGNDGPGIGSWRSNNVKIYNNTTYGNVQDSASSHTIFAEIFVGSNAEDVSNVVVKNNIAQATEANTYAIYCDAYCEGSSGLDISSNAWYTSASNWYYWDSGGGNNLATWNALTGVGTDLNSDPLMVNPGSNDFTLQFGSPAVGAGVNLGATYDDALGRASSWPSSVVIKDQDLYHKWEIGAYVHPDQQGPGVGLMQ